MRHFWELNPNAGKIACFSSKRFLWQCRYPTVSSWERIRRCILHYAIEWAHHGYVPNTRFILNAKRGGSQ